MTGVRIGILAGESSGDNLGAGLMLELRRRYPNVEFIGVGGPKMQAAELELLADFDSLAVNGFVEPIKQLPNLIALQRQLIDTFEARGVTAFIGVDFNVFNFLLERRLKSRGLHTIHYVSPSVYAWRRGRVKRIAKSVELLLTLFPFEPAFYRDSATRAVFVGHPMADEIPVAALAQESAQRELGIEPCDYCVALLPGTRRSELEQMLDLFLNAARLIHQQQPNAQFVLPCPRPELRTLVAEKIAQHTRKASSAASTSAELAGAPLPVTLVPDHARSALTACHGAIVKSGTSTLEAMLLKRPMVVSYRLGTWTYRVVKPLLRTAYVALPNILAERPLVPELLQDAATPEALAAELLTQVERARGEASFFAPFIELHETLRCNASSQAAHAVADFLQLGPSVGEAGYTDAFKALNRQPREA